MLKLIKIAQKEVEPELEKSYYNTYYCQLKNKTLANQMFTRVFCRERGSVHYKYMSMFSGFSLDYNSIG